MYTRDFFKYQVSPFSYWKSQVSSSAQQMVQQGQTTSPKQSAYKVTMDEVHGLVVSMELHMKDMSPVILFKLRVSESAIR